MTFIEHRLHRLIPAVLILFALLAAAVPAAAVHPNHPQGFDPERAYQGGFDQIDQIDLFSGRLSLTIPIGPFSLIYNSNVWRYQSWDDGDGVPRIRATPDEQNTGGLGWYLGWGEVYNKNHWYNNTNRWLFVSDDGGRHVFYPTLHKGESNVDSSVLYSRDGSYLRLRVHNNYFVDIESPDGTVRRYDSGTGGLGTTYRLSKVWSAFTSVSDPDLDITYSADGLTRTVTDRYDRTHYVHLVDDHPWIQRVVSQVDVQGFAGQRAVYDFHYTVRNVDVSCKNDSSSMPPRIAVPHLRQIDLPDGTSYSMEDAGGLLYHNLCQSGMDDIPGILRGIDVPTGGGIRWDFQAYEFPPGDTNSVFNTSTGVAARRLIEADGSVHGTWTYKTTSFGAGGGTDPEVHTQVVAPTGDCSKHYFNARYWVSPAEGRGWERGLPFVYSASSDGKYLSAEVWTSNAGGACAGTKLRSTYLRFRRDGTPGSGSAPLEDWYNTNRQIEASRVVYHDDGDRHVDVELTEFDGLGHFRRQESTGTLRASATEERRTMRYGFNRSTGTYPGDYVPVLPTDPWILGIFDAIEIEEPDALGETVKRVEYDFERDTGFLACTRVLASGTARGATDVLSVFTRNTRGQVTDSKVYGGDLQPLSLGGAGCGTTPGQPAAWMSYTYAQGTLASSRPRTPAGGFGPLVTYDVDVDPDSGLVEKSRSLSGHEVTFEYDEMGRATRILPAEGAWVRVQYLPPSAGSAAKTVTTRHAASGTELMRAEVLYDDFGRARLERRKLPGGVWSERETERNARGWITSVSQWGNLGKKTQYLDFDPFGRPLRTRPPDGAGHDVLHSYLGDRRATRQVKRQLASGESYVSASSEFDSHGRLRLVEEPSGAGGSMTPTVYDYAVGTQLARVVSGAASGPQQVRQWQLDNRGFLLWQQYPEAGAAGNGKVYYQEYDAQGLPHRKVDGPHDLGFEYDFMGRPTATRDRNHGNRLLTEMVYDGAPGFGDGKLWHATQHNYIDLPWTSHGEEDLAVRTTYAYLGRGGRVSAKDTRLWWSEEDMTFSQSYGYGELGNLTQMTYPRCITAACAGDSAATGPQIGYSYNQGLMTKVIGWAPQITYHPSGAWSTVQHANGVTDHQTVDPSYGNRIRRLHTTGVAAGPSYDSGTYSYDGVGNIKAIGGDTFAYDRVGRLAEANLYGYWQQSYSYDAFGNLTSMTDPDTGGALTFAVDATTNRLSGAIGYDAAGNVASWGGYQFTYNESNRLTSQAHMRYVYDAAGERVGSIANAPWAPNMHIALRDLDQRLVSKIYWDGDSWQRDRDYVFAGQRLLASVREDGSPLFHFHLDHTGSPRLLTRADGSAETEQYLLPYGREVPYETNYDNFKLAGHERDFSTGSDYMHARHYLSYLGRFLSVDPVVGNVATPQRLNRYAYALNNPVNRIDPDGRQPEETLSGRTINVVKGAYRYVRYPYDTYHGGAHVHVYRRKGGELLGRVSVATGKIVDGGQVPKRALKLARGLGLIRGAGVVGVVWSLVDADDIEAGDLYTPEEWEQIIANSPPVTQADYDAFFGTDIEDPETGETIVIDEVIEVTGEPIDVDGGDGDDDDDDDGDGDDTDTATAEGTDPDRPSLVEMLRAGWSLRQLWDFSCMMSPTTCYQGFGGGGGTGGVHTHLHQYY